MALTADTPRAYELGEFNDLPVKAATTVYEGAAVGDDGSGYARGLVAGDPFRGFCTQQADNSAGSAGDINVRTRVYGRLPLTITSIAITDVGKDVYASADGTFTLTQGSNSPIGKVYRYVTTNTAVVAFDARTGSSDLPNHQHTTGTDGGALTSPHVVTGIEDANGAESILLTATASAVNEITVANAATGSDPAISATGGDTNIGLTLTPKGTGVLTLNGPVTVTDAKDVTLGTTTGSVIGAATNQKLAFFGATPVTQQAHVADVATDLASGATASLNTLSVAINGLFTLIETIGFRATS